MHDQYENLRHHNHAPNLCSQPKKYKRGDACERTNCRPRQKTVPRPKLKVNRRLLTCSLPDETSGKSIHIPERSLPLSLNAIKQGLNKNFCTYFLVADSPYFIFLLFNSDSPTSTFYFEKQNNDSQSCT